MNPVLTAIVMATFQQMNVADTHEIACVVIETADGSLYTTAPSRQNEGNFRLRITLHHGETIAAIMHTHPSTGVAWDQSEQFSEADKDMARTLHVPSFVYVVKLGKVILFDPNTEGRQ